MTEVMDVAVVGAGPCGIAAGAALKKAGLKAVLFDKGCITASIVDYPPYMTFFSTARNLELEDAYKSGLLVVAASGILTAIVWIAALAA